MPTPAKTTRFDHSNCKHAKSGAEGKKARAACRKEHALAAAKKPVRKAPARTPNPAKATTARKPRAGKAVAPKVLDMSKAEVNKVDVDTPRGAEDLATTSTPVDA